MIAAGGADERVVGLGSQGGQASRGKGGVNVL